MATDPIEETPSCRPPLNLRARQGTFSSIYLGAALLYPQGWISRKQRGLDRSSASATTPPLRKRTCHNHLGQPGHLPGTSHLGLSPLSWISRNVKFLADHRPCEGAASYR